MGEIVDGGFSTKPPQKVLMDAINEAIAEIALGQLTTVDIIGVLETVKMNLFLIESIEVSSE